MGALSKDPILLAGLSDLSLERWWKTWRLAGLTDKQVRETLRAFLTWNYERILRHIDALPEHPACLEARRMSKYADWVGLCGPLFRENKLGPGDVQVGMFWRELKLDGERWRKLTYAQQTRKHYRYFEWYASGERAHSEMLANALTSVFIGGLARLSGVTAGPNTTALRGSRSGALVRPPGRPRGLVKSPGRGATKLKSGPAKNQPKSKSQLEGRVIDLFKQPDGSYGVGQPRAITRLQPSPSWKYAPLKHIAKAPARGTAPAPVPRALTSGKSPVPRTELPLLLRLLPMPKRPALPAGTGPSGLKGLHLEPGQYLFTKDSQGRTIEFEGWLVKKQGGRDPLAESIQREVVNGRTDADGKPLHGMHLVPDAYNGPAIRDNIVPGAEIHNLSYVKSVENAMGRHVNQFGNGNVYLKGNLEYRDSGEIPHGIRHRFLRRSSDGRSAEPIPGGDIYTNLAHKPPKPLGKVEKPPEYGGGKIPPKDWLDPNSKKGMGPDGIQ